MGSEGSIALAHVRQLEGDWEIHELEEHLTGVARLTERFAAKFGSRDWGALAGYWHDLGKFSPQFQSYIRRSSGYDPEAHIETGPGRVDHSTAGALYAVDRLGSRGHVLAYLIAGHHAGLPDWRKIESDSGGVLEHRLARKELLERVPLRAVSKNILERESPQTRPVGGPAGFALWVRMLFSCLRDADCLDTEAFMDPGKRAQRGGYPALDELRERFDNYMRRLASRAPDTPVNRLRREILHQCREAAQGEPGIFSLTVPTGGGKTLSSMAFALEHAKRHGLERIIYVIPYTSIIEQTADVFRSIFGEAVVEHHSNLDPDQEDAKSRLAAENWDAPVIVTTNVQFFESLFAAKTSRCRKLHNICNSVVVLDEAQLLPPEFLQPILGCMNLLARHYGVSFILSTATQPALHSRSGFGWRFKGLENVREIMRDPDELYAELERVEVELPADFQAPIEWERLAEELSHHQSVLAIVNTRSDARTLHALMPKGTYHLSALMCGQHRSDVIAEIKQRLRRGEPVRVVSTQLVEAGVDMDFPVVYRAMAGLDSIAQAAGRCNREGRLPGKGRVVVFVPPKPAPPGHLRRAEQTTVSLFAGERPGNPLGRDCFRRYFEHFYVKAPSLDKEGIEELLKPDDNLGVQFRTAANRFRLIEESGYRPVLVRYGNNDVLLGKLKKEGPERWLMRKLQRYTVNVSEYHFKALLEGGDIREICPGIHVQSSDTLYDPKVGLLLADSRLPPEQLIC